MKKLLFSLIVSLFAVSVWAADVSVTEKFTRVTDPGVINTTTTASGLVRSGDVCNWNFQKLRYSSDVITVGSTNYTAVWLNKNSNTEYSELATTNLEGGIKSLSFRWAQFGKETGNTLKLKVSAGNVEHNPAVTRDGGEGANYSTGGAEYSHTFELKSNGQLTITNNSAKDGNNACRILVCNISITPYLLYRNKDVTIGLKQRGYANSGSVDFINNTGSEGSIEFSSSNESVAKVDLETGVITPVAIGDAVITATWSEGASTTYTLHVVDGIIAENFSKVVQTGQTTGTTWHGDLFDWTVANVRRGEADTLGLNPRIQGTAMRSNAGSTIISANAIEGGVKHIAFDWRQWASATTPLTFKAYYSQDTENWGDAVATQVEDAVKASEPHMFDADIDNGAKGNAYLKLEYTSGAGVAVLGALKITPWLLYTTKEATLDTRNSLTYTNSGLINNTTGDAPTYEIAPANAAVSISAEGQVAVEEGADVNGDFTVTATWGAVTTSYTLHILSRSTANVSFAQEAVRIGLDGSVENELDEDDHDGTATYESSNTAVASVASNGAITIKGVGQTTITATLPQTANYKAASASYNLYVRDNGAQIEMFSGVSQSGVVGETLTDWNGDLFTWQAQYQVRRGTNDTIHAGISKHQGTSIGIQDPTGTPLSSILQSKGAVEGGIKYLTFYWMQWGAAGDGTRHIAVYADDELIGYQENPNGASGKTGDEFMLGINNAMKSNKQLIIKNESYKGSVGTLSDASNSSRIVLDNIYITPYLLYTTKEHTLDMKSASSCTYTPDIDNTESGSITYSLEDNDGEASIDAESGEVTGIKAGEVTVKATWSEGAFTTYTLTILAKSVTEASYPNAIVRIGLEGSVDNTLAYTEGYDGTIAYASSNTAVASVASNGAITINGVGQTTITATLLETENYLAAEASYNLYVRDENAKIEGFSEISGVGVIEDSDEFDEWEGDLKDWFTWERQYQVRRTNNDTIHAGTTKHQATSIGIKIAEPIASSILRSKGEIEGGIKYLSFYWAQWGAAQGNTIRRIAVYAGEDLIGADELPAGSKSGNESMLAINHAIKANKQLVIKNESYQGSVGNLSTASNASRIVMDNIYITPWLLFEDKAERVMRIGETDKNESLINNTGGAASYESSDPTVASVAGDGTVTAIARGKVIITAKYQWSAEEFVTTTYPVTVWPVNCETFSNEATASSYAANEESAAGDKATWRARLAGINVGDFEPNVAFIRAPRQGEDKEAYLYSSPIAGGIGSMTFDWNLVAGEANTNWDIRVLVNGREVKRLGNSDLATEKMENFAQIIIEDINEPDNFVIRFENHSTINGTYTSGNKARFVIDNICWENYSGTKTLAEDDATNESWIRANGGQTRDVIISRSALVGGVWNTLCLPFAISKASDLDDAEVKEMTSVDMEGEVLNIYFNDIEGDELQAGKPYLVKPTADKNISGTYENKVIAMIASPVVQGIVTMQGLYSPMNVTKDDYNTLFVGTPDAEGNNLFYPQADGTLRGLRAYFKIGGAPLPAPRRARYVVTQKDVVTGIESVQNSDVRIQKIIRDGQLFIIHDGKMYNAQGQVIK